MAKKTGPRLPYKRISGPCQGVSIPPNRGILTQNQFIHTFFSRRGRRAAVSSFATSFRRTKTLESRRHTSGRQGQIHKLTHAFFPLAIARFLYFSIKSFRPQRECAKLLLTNGEVMS